VKKRKAPIQGLSLVVLYLVVGIVNALEESPNGAVLQRIIGLLDTLGDIVNRPTSIASGTILNNARTEGGQDDYGQQENEREPQSFLCETHSCTS
jgi:hypothetical protein